MFRRKASDVEPARPLIAILVPVLNRPWRASPLVEGIRATSDAHVVFLCSRHDGAQIQAATAAAAATSGVSVEVVPFPWSNGDYARKINYGVAVTDEPWVFQAGDDLEFHPGWEQAAFAAAGDVWPVVGTNDLGNPRVVRGRHSTHSLVARSYVEEFGTVDEAGKMLHEGYCHNFVDDEFVQTAQARQAFVFAAACQVEHRHPSWGKAEDDDTYRQGLAGWDHDSALLRARMPLWRR